MEGLGAWLSSLSFEDNERDTFVFIAPVCSIGSQAHKA
jgi:hypothetical protein